MLNLDDVKWPNDFFLHSFFLIFLFYLFFFFQVFCPPLSHHPWPPPPPPHSPADGCFQCWGPEGRWHRACRTWAQQQKQQQTGAATVLGSSRTPDPTVHHVPVIWILVLADRVEKGGRQGEGRRVSLRCEMKAEWVFPLKRRDFPSQLNAPSSV